MSITAEPGPSGSGAPLAGPPPRRWPTATAAVALLAVAAVAVALVWIPAWTMLPFRPQTAAAMSRAYALRRAAPVATLVALAIGAALAGRLWRSSRWIGRALAMAALLPLAAAAWVSRQNHFEWLFPPLHHPGYDSAAAAASFVEPGDMVLAVEIRGEAAAYPVRQIAFHHVVEDVAGGTPLAVTY
jgi:cobalamin synthase